MKISIIIPHWPMIPVEHNPMLKRCIASFGGRYEIIVVVNDGIGFAKAVNMGLEMATGDYLFVVNNDVWLHDGDLEEMCKPDVVTSPVVNNGTQKFWSCFFCVPRTVYEKVGTLDEQFEIGCYEDDDYALRIIDAGFGFESIPSVKVVGEFGQTIQRSGNFQEVLKKNEEKFMKKWGDRPEHLINSDMKRI